MSYSFFPNDFHSLPNLQDNATMNYLTQHYKNLSEQLQAKVNHLNHLLEKARETEDVIIDDAERDEGEYHPTLQGRLAKGKGKKRGRQVDVEPGRAIVGVSKETEINDAHELADDEADKNNIYRTGRPLKVRKSEIRRVVETADLGVTDADGDGDRDTQDVLLHLNIVNNIARHHSFMYPHVRAHMGGGPFDTGKSANHIKKILGARRPVFKSTDEALAHMAETGDFAPDTLNGPNGYMHPKDDRYSEMLVDVDNSIFKEQQEQQSAAAYQAERAKHLKAGTYES